LIPADQGFGGFGDASTLLKGNTGLERIQIPRAFGQPDRPRFKRVFGYIRVSFCNLAAVSLLADGAEIEDQVRGLPAFPACALSI
jgi:hypothetical protein